MSHHHGHCNHHPPPANYNRAFAIGITLNVVFVIIEATFGFFAHSLALIADAGHNLSDVLSLLLAWGAALLASRKPTPRRTYGFRRVTILASLISSTLLLMALGAIALEAIDRFRNPAEVDGPTVIVVAGIGVVINTATALLFFSGQKHDLNIKAAYLHMAADAGVSLGVVVAGTAIMLTGLLWIDPVLSLLIVAIILVGTWNLLTNSLNLALDSVPESIDPAEVEDFFLSLPEVTELHDLHIWAMSTTETALTVHLVVPHPPEDDALLQSISQSLHDRFRIQHATVQVEQGNGENSCTLDRPECIG